MRVRLAYGRDGLDVEVPDDAVVVTGSEPPALTDERQAVLDALRSPLEGPSLGALVEATRRDGPYRVAVVFPDLTRPMPRRTVLPPLLDELAAAGVEDAEITLVCATGTHRKATRDEMVELLGESLVARYAIVDHDCTDAAAHVHVGDVDGAPVLLDGAYAEADLRIVTGFVEPHFFAGFSGGPKAVCPGVAAMETVLEAHAPARIAHPMATWAVLDGNPVHDFVRAATALCPPHLSLDVTIDGERRLTGVFAGPLHGAHRAACAFSEATAIQKVPGYFEVVVSTNGGYPLDRNLYQAAKGMSAAERVVRAGGTILVAAQCVDGLPDEGGFHDVLRAATAPEDLVDDQLHAVPDGWQAQVLGRVLARARVGVKSELSAADAALAFVEPIVDLDAAVRAALAAAGPGARVCVLPQGPLTVATPV
jgi:nickel-dependent lactate racemase